MTETPETPTSEPVEATDAPQTFDAEYVQTLKDEAISHRHAAKEAAQRGDALAEMLLTRSIEQATDGVLIDPTDLPRDGDYFAEDGTPDLLKIRAAAEALADAKPHLTRPRGDVAQGVQEQSTRDTWGDLLRAAVS